MGDHGIGINGGPVQEKVRWYNSKKVASVALLCLLVIASISGLSAFMVFVYQDSNRMAVEVQHKGIVKKSEIIFIPAYYDGKTETPAKVVNYLEVECKNNSTTFRLSPAYLNEFMQEGDTVIVCTYHSKVYNLESGTVRYRWDGELYE